MMGEFRFLLTTILITDARASMHFSYFLDEPVITYGRQPGSEVESSHTVSESPYDKTDPMNEKGIEGISVSIMPVL
jgi:hypothetical protein